MKNKDISLDFQIDVLEQNIDEYNHTLLITLLSDKTTNRFITWSCDEYQQYGSLYQKDKEILPQLITQDNTHIIQPRIAKNKEQQRQRTKASAEVFTPAWVCNEMINQCDENWFGHKDIFNIEKHHTWESTKEPIHFETKKWQEYVDLTYLEITCGEAPFLVSRYDTTTGAFLPLKDRIGVLDRKLRVISENTTTKSDWFHWAERAYQSTYGYEYQGDNLLLARENLLLTFIDYFKDKFHTQPTCAQITKIADIIAWNLWQMDGLKNTIPNAIEQPKQFDFFDTQSNNNSTPIHCQIKNWRTNKTLLFSELAGGKTMKFDYCIGNPPYQADLNNLRLYPYFYISGMSIASCVELIFPTAWQEPKNTNGLGVLNNKKIKSDPQIVFIDNKHNIFEGVPGAEWTNIIMWKNGYNNGLNGKQLIYSNKENPIHRLLPININEILKPKEILSIYQKVEKLKELKISSIGSARKPYGFEADPIDDPQKYNLTIYPNNTENAVRLFGRKKGIGRFSIYIDRHNLPKISPLLDQWKLFVVKAWGNMDEKNGFLGGSYSEIIIAEPGDCCSEMYIEFGPFPNKETTENAKKYFYSKFFRAVFYKNKVSQNTAKETYSSVPLQDFTNSSDIDWSKSVHEIDLQLYKKYNLSEEEITFIETRVKEMI